MEPIKSNLEPIEEGDLNLEEKFKTGGSSEIPVSEQVHYAPEKEAAQEVSAGEKGNAYSDILSKVQGQTQSDFGQDIIISDADDTANKTDAQSQIQHLVDIAQQKGVIHAVKVARHMEDNYVLDQFHDKLLSQELHDALLAKGMIKEI